MTKSVKNLICHTKSPKSVSVLTKIVLGVIFFGFILGYQPSFHNGFPPIKKNLVHAQQQSQIISSDDRPLVFQLPHPGYLSTSYSTWHPGIDIATGLGMPVKAIARGTVISTGFDIWGLGLNIVVKHPNNYQSTYAHLGRIYVQAGQTITEKDLIGEVGLTGKTTGPHTHLEVKKEEEVINPTALLPNLRDFPKEEDFKVYTQKAADVKS